MTGLSVEDILAAVCVLIAVVGTLPALQVLSEVRGQLRWLRTLEDRDDLVRLARADGRQAAAWLVILAFYAALGIGHFAAPPIVMGVVFLVGFFLVGIATDVLVLLWARDRRAIRAERLGGETPPEEKETP